MDRLTVNIEGLGLCRGQVCEPNPCYQISTDTMTGECSQCPTWGRITDQLAAYEDLFDRYNLTIEQVEGWAKANEDGRLVELPCKVGDAVYIFGYPCSNIQCDNFHEGSYMYRDDDDCNIGYHNCPHKIVCEYKLTDMGTAFRILYSWNGNPNINKSVFLTPEAAEKALAERNRT